MTHNLAPDTGDSIALQLDELIKSYHLPNALESVNLGQLLFQVKNAMPHGEFQEHIKSLGVHESIARKHMTCAKLFDPDRDAALLTAVKSKGKLFELLVLEPVEIEALSLGEEVCGLTLERLESMTARKLNGALRQRREENEKVALEKRRNPAECITVGMHLLQIRAESSYREFRNRLNELGFEYSKATRYMECARRFDPQLCAPLVAAVNSSTKLTRLLVLADDEIEALNRGEEVRGLTLDRLSCMSDKTLCEALRQWREEAARFAAEEKRKKLSTFIPRRGTELAPATTSNMPLPAVAQPLKASQEPVQPSENSSPAPDSGDSIFSQLNEHGRIFSLGNAVEGLMAGNLLLQAEAAVPDGTFKKRVKLLGFEGSAAAAYMACARIFDLEIDAPLVAAAKSISKLRELLILDAEEVEALNQGEEVRGLTLERIALMTVQQLRGALGKEDSQPVKLTWEEETLLRNYRKCAPQARAHVAQAAELLAGR